MEIDFPLEFLVFGTAVSQRGSAHSIQQWKSRIAAMAQAHLPQPHFACQDDVAVTIYYFPSAAMTGDIDNIVKPILDAMSGLIYVDDKQVHRLEVQKFEPGRVFSFAAPGAVLTEGLVGEKPLLYVRVTTDITEGLH